MPETYLKKKIKNAIIGNDSASLYKPVIFDLKKKKDEAALSILLKKNKIFQVIDDWENQEKELKAVKNPRIISHDFLFGGKEKKEEINFQKGVWVYYPWRYSLIHILNKNDYHKVRISRNFNLILPVEQKKFENFRIGFAGLNVGNPAAICLALEGAGWNMKFADFDGLSLSNLNRFRAGVCDLGLNKAILSARQAYEINPFLDIEMLEHGIRPEDIERFLLKPKIDVLIEETDNLKLKIAIREKAREHRIPVLMVTGNGENIIIDIERYDQNQRLPLLNGYLKQGIIDKIKEIQPGKGTLKERIFLARDFMGMKYLTKRLRESFLLVGSRLAGIPQLAESSFLRGAALSYLVRQITIGKKVPSGRYYLKLDNVLK
ncbi:MAG: ThiF family adenylyltransferase [Candidatus Brennerbacteria bacterium]|nr:ThiF family adenylyltransferase [Candidatus Brennerbacteria bacterium]